jgi:TPR repeat protein
MGSKTHSLQHRRSHTDELFIRAAAQEEKGNLRSAFRLYLAAAKAGNTGCQLNLGNFYDDGIGVRRNRSAALHWYKRAYRRGEASAASNIGVMLRKEGNIKGALAWFRKAVRLGDEEAHLEIGKHYFRAENDPAKAIPHLRKVCQSNYVTEAGRQEAAQLLRLARRAARRA